MTVAAAPRRPRAALAPEDHLSPGKLLYEFNWKIVNRCNYRCSYCPYTMQGQWEELTKRDVFSSVDRWIEAWDRIYDLYGSARINITGGEPTYYPRFIDLIAALTRSHRVYITSNFSRKLAWVSEFARRVVPQRLELPLTFHPEFSNLEEFASKAHELRRAGIEHWIYLVCYPPLLERARACLAAFRAQGLRAIPTPFRGYYQGREYPHSYDSGEKAMISEMAGDLDLDNQSWVSRQLAAINPYGKPCHAGQFYLHVENDGKVWRCGQYAGMKMELELGNFLDSTFRLLDKPLPCAATRCGCEWRLLEEFFRKEAAAQAAPREGSFD